ncbi:MAG: N-acetylglucosamine-6-phosphate deacetylase [Clostridiales bacterium]|nr:N-acetylglucosamine-6-phosphate deacetylase [Clostridiales bacterium]
MLYQNALLFTGDFRFIKGSFETENGKFTKVYEGVTSQNGVNLGGALVLPGLIDVHNHGNSGADFSDGDGDGLLKMAAYLGRCGVTSFAPASMTLPYEVLGRAFATAQDLYQQRPAGHAKLLGIQMEGPFFSPAKKGAQNGDYLRVPDFEAFYKLYAACDGLIRIVDIAPELPGALDFIKRAKSLCTVSIAHTDASYEQAKAAIDAGASHVTHLYNAMPPLHHRKPGVIGAAAENSAVRAELICDGMHVHPSAVRLAFSLFGGERMVLISDALRCCGMEEGTYDLGGQQVEMKDGVCKLPDGTLAGSVTHLFDCMKNAISFGVPAADAIRAATYNPACALGVEDRVGSIEVGKDADFVICSPLYERLAVYIDGEKVPD